MTTPIAPSGLPVLIRDYLAAHAAHDTDAALRAFAPAAVVVDDGATYRGTEEIRQFLTRAGAGFRYTSRTTGARREGDARWVATRRLEGDFPGGVVELDHRFDLADDLITELVIAPVDPGVETRPTVVLVHGAFADSSSWNGVVARLRAAGYPVVAVANPLRGLRRDAALVRAVVDGVQGPVVLAGHSYGGTVISEAAVGHPEVRALVYVASFLLAEGESTGELAGRFPGNALGPALRVLPVPGPDGGDVDELSIDQDAFPAVFAADVPADVAALMAVTQRPVLAAALADEATGAAWRTVPSWTLVTVQDLAVPAAAQRFMAERASSTVVEVDASHAVTVSRPDVVADLIEAAARATAG